jgi:hypothetical protein
VTDLMVTMRHVRAARLCSRGARAWCEAHGFSWSGFLDDGLPADVLEATGDPFALQAVAAARAEQEPAHG